MPAETGEPLSNRELEILECVVAGMVNKEIASELHISENTVKVHLRNVYTKLGVSTRTEATTEAIRLGLVMIPGTTETVSDLSAESSAADTGITATEDDAETNTAVSPPDNTPATIAHPSRWLLVIGILLIGAIAIGTIIVLNNSNGTVATEPTPEPFTETALSDNWLRSRSIPVTTAKAAVASFGLDLYLMSGEQKGEISNDVHLYDTGTRTWDTRAEKPTAVSEATAAELGGVIFVPGGLTADGQPTNIVEVYSPANNAWGQVASLPVPTSGGLTLTDGGLIYFIGGFNGREYLNTGYLYDPGADSWRPLTRMTHPRAFAAGGVIGNNLYVVGGFDGEAELDTCEVYDLTNDSWSSCTPMLSPRGGAGTAVLVNKLYVIGGGMEDGNSIEFSEVYDPSSGTWSLLNTPMLGSNDRWANVGVTSIENRIYALGGIRSDGLATDDNLAYAPLIYQTFIPAASGGGGEE